MTAEEGGYVEPPEPIEATIGKGEYVLTAEMARAYRSAEEYIKARYGVDPREGEETP